MTTIIALKDKDKIYMAADSMTSRGKVILESDQKLFKKGKMIIGYSGYSRFGKLLKYGFNIPEQDDKTNDMTYLNTVFVDSLMEFLDKKQFNKKYDSRVTNEQHALMCYNGNIYFLSGNYDVCLFDGDFHCCGSGEEIAYGSMETSGIMKPDVTPEERMTVAIKAAIKYTSSGGNIKILSMNM